MLSRRQRRGASSLHYSDSPCWKAVLPGTQHLLPDAVEPLFLGVCFIALTQTMSSKGRVPVSPHLIFFFFNSLCPAQIQAHKAAAI